MGERGRAHAHARRHTRANAAAAVANDFPAAAVYTFEYPCGAELAALVEGQRTVRAHANALLDDLEAEELGAARPLVLVGHSLGGLVVKQAVALARARGGATTFRGVVLYGTPDAVTNAADWAAYAREVLRRESAPLEQAVAAWCAEAATIGTAFRGCDVPSLLFAETAPLPGHPQALAPITRETDGAHKVVQVLGFSHETLCRPRSVNDVSYHSCGNGGSHAKRHCWIRSAHGRYGRDGKVYYMYR